ncbi:hypothetical protein N9N28_02345 [Rubripirellula amarantea]|uniref:Uncharacterized protein n=1 Tax=Rubripirellula amarantea TaxID=2527999 RepID=A0A5C5WB35_9BACT|nr:hypothetical protein [Rubripirellula amarantea]MDA8743450.1 hypothetical protein [Rubripirellula amarantea]TWT48126.1 hypothetical protein Pla22_51270 [Rubripirellula amarantea]
MTEHSSNHEASFFEKPKNINLMIGVLVVMCLATVLADLFYTNPHQHFDIETTFGFQAWFGFVAFVVIVFLGRAMRLIVKRPEDYYDADDADIVAPSSGGHDAH